jgi:beta-mannosidase
MAETSAWLQKTGYKAVFETARRQKPYCSMAINWCWCEPWKCAVNNSLIAYPQIKKAAWYAVRDSLRDVLGAAQIPKFMWAPGERLTLVPWLLNDTRNKVKGRVTLSVVFRGEKNVLGTAELEARPLANAKGAPLSFTIPADAARKERFTVVAELEPEDGAAVVNPYELVIEGTPT